MKKTTKLDLPAMLRAWRQKEGITRQEAARRLDVKMRTLEGWEQGRFLPRGETILAILNQIPSPRWLDKQLKRLDALDSLYR